MPVIKRTLDTRLKGPHMETEDWWHLAFDTETNDLFVEHEWSHTSLGTSVSDSGTKRRAIAEFLGDTAHEAAKARATLRELIRSLVGGQDA